MKRGM